MKKFSLIATLMLLSSITHADEPLNYVWSCITSCVLEEFNMTERSFIPVGKDYLAYNKYFNAAVPKYGVYHRQDAKFCSTNTDAAQSDAKKEYLKTNKKCLSSDLQFNQWAIDIKKPASLRLSLVAVCEQSNVNCNARVVGEKKTATTSKQTSSTIKKVLKPDSKDLEKSHPVETKPAN